MITVWLLFFLAASSLHALVNPFACKRPHAILVATGPAQLQDFEFIGVVSGGCGWRAVVRWRDRTKTVSIGEYIGPVHVVGIDSASIKVNCKNKEFILTIKSE